MIIQRPIVHIWTPLYKLEEAWTKMSMPTPMGDDGNTYNVSLVFNRQIADTNEIFSVTLQEISHKHTFIMKRTLFILGLLLCLTACTSTLPKKFTRLADKVESQSTSLTEAQWEKYNAQFEKLITEYSENYDSFTRAQRKEINNAIGRYSKAVIRSGVQSATEIMNDILEELPGTINSLLEGARDFLDGLSN